MSAPYATLAAHYDALLGAHALRLAGLVAAAIERHRPGAAALCDVGCGTGLLLERFAARGLDVTGIERSPAMARLARRRLRRFGRRARVVVGDLRSVALDTVKRAIAAAALELVEVQALTGVSIGPRTGRIAYLARANR